MPSAGDYIVVYDLSEDGERDKVSSLLEGFGFRIQWSVFECRLTKAGIGSLHRELERLALESGTVCIYRRLKGAVRLVHGKCKDGAGLPEENPSIFIV